MNLESGCVQDFPDNNTVTIYCSVLHVAIIILGNLYFSRVLVVVRTLAYEYESFSQIVLYIYTCVHA